MYNFIDNSETAKELKKKYNKKYAVVNLFIPFYSKNIKGMIKINNIKKQGDIISFYGKRIDSMDEFSSYQEVYIKLQGLNYKTKREKIRVPSHSIIGIFDSLDECKLVYECLEV